jgi:transcription-repair coupling factor (superfamily II helicase)
MRGRVGRSNRRAFCYLLSPPLSTLTPEARKRLSAVEEFSDLGSGFNIAMRDLDIRGAGNLLGAEQSGFIAEIGYEMYHKILDEAVQELKNDEFKDLFDDTPPRPYVSFTQIDTDQELLIPDEYVTSPTERYNLYTAMSKLENETELTAFRTALIDRFGPIPRQVKELIRTIRLQWLSKELGFERVILKGGLLKAYFISEKNSSYFDSPAFERILYFVQTQGTRYKLREQSNSLALVVSGVGSIHEAHEIFKSILPQEMVSSEV